MVESDSGNKASLRAHSGFTLLEITVAMAIFAVTLGSTAQGLAYAFGLVNLQNQRVTANNDCRAVISALRQVGLDQPDTTACPANANKFPCVLLDWRNSFPGNAAEVAALSATARMPFAGMYTLRDETFTIDLTSASGQPAVNGTGSSTSTNPVHVTVTVRWTGPRGITYTEVVSTAITNY
jgi:prepilin-type N-terminal cleavage/methylation domain-containing protein